MIAETEVKLFMLIEIVNTPADDSIPKGPERYAAARNILLQFRLPSSDRHFLPAQKQMAARDTPFDGQSIEIQIAYLELYLKMSVHDSKIY